jgi:tetratricopeptide (TPR) repeat protein
MNLEKIKESARKYEAAQDWRRAIEVYQKAIQEYESGADPSPDVGVYNKVGDLHLKANEPAAAVQVFERAVDLYTDQGFTNNAIALCGKILRVNPGRVQVYLKLAQLHARKNVVTDAKKNLIEYVERMNAFNKLEEAAEAAKKFAEQFADVAELRTLVVELINAAAREHADNPKLQQLVADLAQLGDSRASTAVRRPSRMSTAIGKPKAGDLVFLDVGDEEEVKAPPPPRAAAPAAPPKPATPPPVARPVAPPTAPKPAAPVAKPVAPAVRPVVPAPKPAAPPPKPAPPPVPEPLGLERTSLVDDDATPVMDDTDMRVETPALDGLILDGMDLGAAADAELPDLEMHEELPDLTSIEVPDDITPADITLTEAEAPSDLSLEETPELDAPLGGLGDEDAAPVLRATGGHAAFTGNTFESDPAEESVVELPMTEELTFEEPAVEEPLEFIEAEAPRQLSTAEWEERIIDDPENPEHHRSLGEALLAAGETQRGHEELELALDRYEAREEWPKALDVAKELISLDTSSVKFYQKRVELAFRLGDREYLVDSYLELGDALLRSGAVDKAVAVYRRVAEHDPGNQRAASALLTLAGEETPTPAKAALKAAPAKPAAPAAAAPPVPRASRPVPVAQDGFVDLGSFIMDDEQPASTRMRIEEEEPSGDEEKDFSSMLSAFKQGIEKTVAEEDFQTHYDLGVAFKEMGLLDEAIGEFQKALRAPEGKLRSSEALGTAFFEKEQYGVAETILKRAVENITGSDDEKLGLWYWLGRSYEAQQKAREAQGAYQHVTAVNIKFLDTADRVKSLKAGTA